jgi:hypothetical protein
MSALTPGALLDEVLVTPTIRCGTCLPRRWASAAGARRSVADARLDDHLPDDAPEPALGQRRVLPAGASADELVQEASVGWCVVAFRLVRADPGSDHADIERMRMGYESLIADMGNTPSGGQKQRVC